MCKELLKQEWCRYVDEHLLPRINAFELMMAPYSVAHMKLAMTLKDTGYDFSGNNRLNVFLSNTLEKPGNSDMAISLFDDPLALESIEANATKKNNGINVVIGNPPYSFTSSNRQKWIMDMLEDYKRGLNERKIHLDDDYIKFIRYSESLVEKNSFGAVVFITNNSFLNGITHRVMRSNLTSVFSKIYVLNLHGDAKKGETDEYGGKDENVFDIQQGVSISILIKNDQSKTRNAVVNYYDLYGTRLKKYEFLTTQNIDSISWKTLNTNNNYCYFVPVDFSQNRNYDSGFQLNQIFKQYSQGVLSGNDSAVMKDTENEAVELISELVNSASLEEAEQILYHGDKQPKNWSLRDALSDLRNGYSIERIQYRPFDFKFTAYTETSCGWLWRPRTETMVHLRNKCDNLNLITTRAIQKGGKYTHLFVSNCISDKGMLSSKDNCYAMPAYLYIENFGKTEKISNFKEDFKKEISRSCDCAWNENSGVDGVNTYTVFCYIYAILSSAKYREKYNDMLIADFPKVPYPKNMQDFIRISKIGSEIIQLHLCEKIEKPITSKIEMTDLLIENINYKNETIYLNKASWIANVPESVWNYYVGSYLPVQKWIKDRKGKMITQDDLDYFIDIISNVYRILQITDELDEIIG